MRGLLAAVLLALVSCGGGGDPNICDLNQENMISHITTVRKEQVQWSPELAAAAQAHANELVKTGIPTHVSVDGSSHIDRALRAGWPNSFVAENLAQGDLHGQAHVLELLDASPGHLRNTTWPGITHIGGACAGGTVWVIELGGK